MKHFFFLLASGVWLLVSQSAHAIIDSNSNSMSDVWERQFNNNQLLEPAFLPGGDADGDGQSNLDESISGTDPLHSNPPVGHFIQSIRHVPATWLTVPDEEPVLLTPEAFEIDWLGLPGKRYVLSFSHDLTEESWHPVGVPVIGSGATLMFGCLPEQEGGGMADKLFWRVAVDDIDTDSDGLTNHEESIFGTESYLSETFTGLPDAWLASYYTSVTNFVPTQDDDWDGLTNFAEYLHRTNPLNPDTDGDGTPDGVEVGHGGNPNNAGDGGNPPSDPVEDVEFTVGGDFATWRMEIKATGPRDNRTLNLTSPQPGQNETQSFKLWKNNRYEITLHRTGGYDDWYCWEAQTDGQPAAGTFGTGDGWVSEGERNEQSHFFTLAGHWLVDNRQGLLTSHLHSQYLDVASPLKTLLVPVAIEDNIEATGVDIVSNSVVPEVAGYEDKLWIMAPISGPPPPADYSNLMKFHIPLSPEADMEIECDHSEADPATVTLNNAKPEALWRGIGANATNDNTSVFKIGEHQDVVDLPIEVKTMKHRTVRVRVHLVNLLRQDGQVRAVNSRMLPTESALGTHLYEVFARQINTWFVVEYDKNPDGTPKFVTVDPGTDGNYDFRFQDYEETSPDQQETLNQTTAPGNPDIRVFIIANEGTFLVQNQELGYGFTNRAAATCWILGRSIGAYNDPDDMKSTIAHEIGHVFVGYGHPDRPVEPGPAPLAGTVHSVRLMCSHANRSIHNGRLLVKKEWDEAEQWMLENIDNQQQ